MKIYNDESPLDLAVRTDLQPPAMTSLIVETLDKVSRDYRAEPCRAELGWSDHGNILNCSFLSPGEPRRAPVRSPPAGRGRRAEAAGGRGGDDAGPQLPRHDGDWRAGDAPGLLRSSLGPGQLRHLPPTGSPKPGLRHPLHHLLALPVAWPVQARPLLRVLLALPFLLSQDLALALPQQLGR